LMSLERVSRSEWRDYVLVIPIASIESHGALPPALDVVVARCLLEMCKIENAIYIPPIPVSTSWEHYGVPPTMSAAVDTIARYLAEIGRSASRWFRAVLFLTTHGGADPVVYAVVRQLLAEGVRARMFSLHRCISRVLSEMGLNYGIVHADPVEGSIALACLDQPVGAREVSKELVLELLRSTPSKPWGEPWTWSDIAERYVQDFVPGSRELGMEILEKCCKELGEVTSKLG